MIRRLVGAPLIGAALLAAASACGPETTPPATPFELAPGEQALLEGGVPLTFLRVVGDSRCPADVDCIWQGDASIAVQLGPPAGEAIALHTSGARGMPRAAEACGYRVELVALAPAPARAGVPVPEAAYRATLVYTAAAESSATPDSCRPQRLR